MRLLLRVLVLSVISLFTLMACSSNDAPSAPANIAPTPTQESVSDDSASVQTVNENTAKPQFLNSYASW